MRGVGWFQVVMGCGIVGVWAMLLSTGQVPEVSEGQIDIWFHLGAELATGAGLVVAGLLVLRHGARAWFAAVRTYRSLASVPRSRPATDGGGGGAAGAADHGRARGSQGSRR